MAERLSDDKMEQVSGGTSKTIPEPKFNINDRVMLVGSEFANVKEARVDDRQYVNNPVAPEWRYMCEVFYTDGSAGSAGVPEHRLKPLV